MNPNNHFKKVADTAVMCPNPADPGQTLGLQHRYAARKVGALAGMILKN